MARPSKPLLSREKVVQAAIAMIGENGLEAFSMPKLASALAVRTPSLYYHFTDKNALLSEVARTVMYVDPVPAGPPPAGSWTDYLVSQAVETRRRICRYPHCAPLLVRYMPRDNMFGEYESMCQYLAASGVPARLHVRIVDGITALTIGAAFLRENAAHYTEGGDGPTPEPGSYPALEAALATVEGSTADELFEVFVRTYLDSVLREIADDCRH